jgi:hypothetical protein
MAGTVPDPSTDQIPPQMRILLGAALALVVPYVSGGRQAAKDLLISFLRRKRIRWGYQRRLGGSPYPHESEANIWSLKHFDDLGLHKYIDVDWDNHSITCTLPDGTGRVFRYKLFLVYLHHDDVLDMLRMAGLMPWPEPIRRTALEQWVFDQVQRDRPKKRSRGYTDQLLERCPSEPKPKKHTIETLISAARKELELPE